MGEVFDDCIDATIAALVEQEAPMTPAIEELEKLVDRMDRAMETIHARELRNIISVLGAEVRERERAAFYEGAVWAWAYVSDNWPEARDEALRRYAEEK